MFTLRCLDAAERSVTLHYDPHKSTLVNEDGTPALRIKNVEELKEWVSAVAISPQSPGTKSRRPKALKVQLGLHCNYSCSYCSQSSQVSSMAASRTADAADFLKDLDKWLEGPPELIEFWGGEPLLYFGKLKVLVPALRARFPGAEMSMVSNGSLLSDEILEFISAHNLLIAISHDGPGQWRRGEDPFADPEKAALLRRLWAERGGVRRMSFNAVLTPDNGDPALIRKWFVQTLDDPEVNVTLEGVVATHDEKSLSGPGRWTARQYSQMQDAIVRTFDSGEALKIAALGSRAREFLSSIAKARPSSALGQKCGMDRSDHLAVDLHGNVLTCQNTGANGVHGIGSAQDMQNVRLDTSLHWSHREMCGHCPVLQICAGSCMYLHGAEFAQSCENEYQFGMGIIRGVLKRTFGLELLSIEGDIRRPKLNRVVPIRNESVHVTS